MFCFGENLIVHYGKQNEKPTHATVPMLVMQHKAPAPPVTAVKPPPPGEDPVWDTWSSHTFRAWGKALNTFVPNIEYRPTLKETGPKGKEEWGNI